jgi:hypothetical protein
MGERVSILSLIALPHPLNLLHNPPSKVLGHEDRELAAVAEDGVEEVVGGIAAEGEERGVGRILALRGMEGLGEEVVDCVTRLFEMYQGLTNR